MQLSINSVIPIPLREKILAKKSDIWNNKQTINQGESLFIQAPSGTGKTTLIHVLYGLRTDYEGEICWNNENIKTIGNEKIANLRTLQLSVIFQDMRLFPELTAYENLEIKRRLTNTISEQQMLDWLDRLGVKEKKNALGYTLSYGEQQRIAIIRSLLQPFAWLLMDEPFSHLDHANTQKAISLIAEVVTQNKAGMLLADLDENDFFPYTKKIYL